MKIKLLWWIFLCVISLSNIEAQGKYDASPETYAAFKLALSTKGIDTVQTRFELSDFNAMQRYYHSGHEQLMTVEDPSGTLAGSYLFAGYMPTPDIGITDDAMIGIFEENQIVWISSTLKVPKGGDCNIIGTCHI